MRRVNRPEELNRQSAAGTTFLAAAVTNSIGDAFQRIRGAPPSLSDVRSCSFARIALEVVAWIDAVLSASAPASSALQ